MEISQPSTEEIPEIGLEEASPASPQGNYAATSPIVATFRSVLGCPPPIQESSSGDSSDPRSDAGYTPPLLRSTKRQQEDAERQRRSHAFMEGGPNPKRDFRKGKKED